MKITRQQLSRIIKEELSRVSEAGPGTPPTYPLDPGGVESMRAQKMAAIDPLYDEFEGDFDALAAAIVELEYGGYGGIIGHLIGE
jgi:hypothetical protein